MISRQGELFLEGRELQMEQSDFSFPNTNLYVSFFPRVLVKLRRPLTKCDSNNSCSYWFLIPLFIQCLLLHPIFPSYFSRPCRLALTPFSTYYSLRAPLLNAFDPRPYAHGANFVLGIASVYGSWKAVEWGLAKDLTPYTWIGLDGHHGKQKRDILERLREQHKEKDDLGAILRWTISLLLSMRGIGWSMGPPQSAIAAHSPRSKSGFLAHTLVSILWSHFVVVLCAICVISPLSSRITFLSTLFPSLDTPLLEIFAAALAAAGLGTATFAGLTLGYHLQSILFLVLTTLLRSTRFLPESLAPLPFDPRAYPPLLNRPWHPKSVTHFWSKQWHSFFSRPFRFLAFDPAYEMFSTINKPLARIVGTMAVFALSACLHEQG